MAKQSGLGWTALTIDSNNIRADVTNWNFATPRGVQDITGIDKFAMERLFLLWDLSAQLNGVTNFDADMSHETLTGAQQGGVGVSFLSTISGQSLGATPAVEVLVTDYASTRNQDGSFTWSAPLVLSNGVIPTWTS